MRGTSTNKRQFAQLENRFARSGSGDRRAQATPRPNSRGSYEQYLALARGKALAGDRIEAERYYQYAEHYHRLMKGTAA